MGVFFGIILISIALLIICLLLKQFFYQNPLRSVEGKHVVVTGGSSGIGKSIAILAAKNGANVTIIARDNYKLELARNEIIGLCKNRDKQRIEFLSLDISDDYDNIEKCLLNLDNNIEPIYMLVNCAGTCIGGKIEDVTPNNLKLMMNLNFMGTYYCTKAIIPRMKASRDGIIVITSSIAGLLGLFGYSAYSSTKFALRGLAESISMELKGHNINVTLGVPPDTDTPGFAVEEKTKPIETKLISQGAGLFTPEQVAKQLFNDALSGKFYSTVGLDGFMTTTLCAGMSPGSVSDYLLQFLLMGPLRIVGACYLASFHRIIQNCMKTRDKSKKSE